VPEDALNDVRPFRALHYDPSVVTDIGECLSQPYDVISPAQQEAYYRQHPHNVIRLILNKEQPGDDERANRYTRARSELEDWRRQGILRSTARPSFWVYEQSFDLPGIGRKTVRGFIGAVRLQDYSERRVLPHEKVLKGPLEDRIRLTEVTGTQFEYIWSLYQDRDYLIDSILDEGEKGSPIIDYVEKQINVRHRLWRLTDPVTCDAVRQAMAPRRIYIADGHHRYQTMLTIRDRMRQRYPDAGPEAPWEYIMMFLVNSAHQGLTILPTHRMLNGIKVESLFKLGGDILEHFHVKKYVFRDGDEPEVRRRWLEDLRSAGAGEHSFGAYIVNTSGYYLLTLRDQEAYEELVKLAFSSEWKLLDVNILNQLILENILGITEEQLSLSTHIAYTKDAGEALEKVRAGEMQVAFILNPTALQDVITIAEHDEKMPRKSTHFYPKPVSGLVFFPLDREFHAVG
jgi:uncharacterized protein (DUF1015 family)